MQNAAQPSDLALMAATAPDEPRAAALARRLDLPLSPTGIDPARCDQARALLIVSGRTLSVQRTGSRAPGPVSADFGSAGMRYRRRSGSGELLARAVGQGRKSPLWILDATAGLGRDAFVLASLGCEVMMCEREPVVVELLRAGLDAAANGDPRLSGVVQHMRLYPGDARALPAARVEHADVLYLDPMFPARRKSAAVKKEMALFQMLLERSTDARDADALLAWALGQDAARVVVKRPAGAPSLAALPPSHTITGKAVRYDVYVRRGLT